MSVPVHVGGSFAPPLTDELLAKYKAMADALPADSQVRDAMLTLLKCCEVWWDLPESTGPADKHVSGRGFIVRLDEPIKKELWDHIPWHEELQVFGQVFDRVDPVAQKPLRDAAHHLLWHVVELNLDREPITTDKL